MSKLKAYRESNIWFNVLLYVISFTFLIVWLPLIRSICDGSSYAWGTNFFGYKIHGAGITFSLLFVIAQFLFYLCLFFSFYWLRNRSIFKFLVISWYAMVFGNFFYDIAMNGDTMFHGDTLNVHVSLLALVLPLGIVTLVLILKVLVKDSGLSASGLFWNKKNTIRLLILYGPVPIQAVLFAFGEPHDITDQIGVIIAILQAFLVPLIVRPYA